MNLERHLVLSRSDWGDLFSNKKVTRAAYFCITIGYILCFVNDGVDLTRGILSIPSIYATIVSVLLTVMGVGVYLKKFYALPLAIIGFDLFYVAINVMQSVIYEIHITELTVCYSLMYFIINSLIFRLKTVFWLNLFIFAAVFFCAYRAINAAGWAGGPTQHSFMVNAILLSAAGFLLQHLVLTVRAMLIEQLGSIKLQIAALEAEMEIEKARKEAREKAIQLNRISIVEALGASIAHEINQPIAAALTYCRAVRNWSAQECRGATETLEALAGVETNVDRAARLIDNIRLLTTNRGRKYALTDMTALVMDQVNLIKAEFDRREIRLEFNPSPDNAKALVCAPEVALATINLLRNALEAFDEGVEDAIVVVGCRQPNADWVEIKVCDNGRGLAPDEIQTAFGAFQSSKEAGAGIGLSICQEVAEHHAGSIFLAQNDTGGLTATLRISVNPVAVLPS